MLEVEYRSLGLGGVASLSWTGGFDLLSRRDAITRPNSTTSDFDYDLASRLTLLTQDVAGTTNDLSRTFTYNLAGQLKTRSNAMAAHWLAATPGSSAYAANGRNQYTTVAGATFGYDLNGNLTSTGSRSYGYDAENRLTSVSGSASLRRGPAFLDSFRGRDQWDSAVKLPPRAAAI